MTDKRSKLKVSASKAPGVLYVLKQIWPRLSWQVVPVPKQEGLAMRRRNEPHVYDSAAQACAVKNDLNEWRSYGKHDTAN